MNWKKPFAVAMTGAMLAGCGSSTGTSTSSTGGTESTGGTITVAMDADLITMDYEVATDGNSFIMQTMCEAGLLRLDEN